MAFGRSNSLSINTGASNSLFNNTNNTQAQKSSNLFGASTNTSQPQSGGLFGASSTTPQTAALSTGGLFGSSSNPSSQPQTGGLFGSNAATTQPSTGGLFGTATQQTGGLFGGSNNAQTQQTQNASGGSLFAAAQPATNTTGGAQSQQAGGLFGSGATQTPQTGGLFGNAQNQNQQQQGGGFFGGLNTQNKPATTPSLFGATTNQTQQKPSLFSSTSQQQTTSTSLFSGMPPPQLNTQPTLSLGQQNNAGNQSVPGVIIDVTNLKPSTRFSDVNEALKKELTDVETFVQRQLQYHAQISAFMASHEAQISTITPDVTFLSNRLESLETALDNDAADIQNIKLTIKRDADEAKLSFLAIEQLKLPTQFHYPGAGFGVSLPKTTLAESDGPSPLDMQSYFNSKQSALAQTIDQHARHVREVEEHLQTVHDSTHRKYNELMEAKNRTSSGLGQVAPKQDNLRDLGLAFQAIETAILNTATKIGEVRENLVDVTLGSRR